MVNESINQLDKRLWAVKPFGAVCLVHISKERRPAASKLDSRAEQAMFLGYIESNKIYRMPLLATGHIMDIPASECQLISQQVTPPTPVTPQTQMYPPRQVSTPAPEPTPATVPTPVSTSEQESISYATLLA